MKESTDNIAATETKLSDREIVSQMCRISGNSGVSMDALRARIAVYDRHLAVLRQRESWGLAAEAILLRALDLTERTTKYNARAARKLKALLAAYERHFQRARSMW
jgi:hypothetical protein